MQHKQLLEIRKQKQQEFKGNKLKSLKEIKEHYTKLKGLNSQLMALHLQPYQKQSDLTEALKNPNSRGLIVKLIELEKNLISLNAEFHSELRSLYEKITAFCPPVKEPATAVIDHHFNALISSVSEYPFGGSDSERFEAYAPMISHMRKFDEVFNRFLGRLIADDILFAEQNAYESNLEFQKEVQNHVDLQELGLGDFAHCSIEIMLYILSNLDIQGQVHCLLLNHAFYTLIEHAIFGQLSFIDLNKKNSGNVIIIDWLILNGYQALVDYIFTHTIIERFDENGKTKQSAIDRDKRQKRGEPIDLRDIHTWAMSDIAWAIKCNQTHFIQSNKDKVSYFLNSISNVVKIKNIFDRAFKQGHIDLIKMLLTFLSKDALLEEFWQYQNPHDAGLLNVAAAKGEINFTLFLLEFILKNCAARLNDNASFLLFHIAAGKGYLDLMKNAMETLKKSTAIADELISKILGLDMTKGRTPFVWAAQFGQKEMLEYLFKCYPVSGSQSLSSVIKNVDTLSQESSIPYDPIFFPDTHKEAVPSLSYREIIEALLEWGADINMPDNEGKTPLRHAVEKENIEAVRFLLNKGADVNEIDSKGNSLLHAFIRKSFLDSFTGGEYNATIFPSLLNSLIEFKVNVNAIDIKGETVLHDLATLSEKGLTSLNFYNVKKFRETAVNILLSAGARVPFKDSAGNTPIDIARLPLEGSVFQEIQSEFLALLLPAFTSQLECEAEEIHLHEMHSEFCALLGEFSRPSEKNTTVSDIGLFKNNDKGEKEQALVTPWIHHFGS